MICNTSYLTFKKRKVLTVEMSQYYLYTPFAPDGLYGNQDCKSTDLLEIDPLRSSNYSYQDLEILKRKVGPKFKSLMLLWNLRWNENSVQNPIKFIYIKDKFIRMP